MSKLLESICINNGEMQNLSYHLARVGKSHTELGSIHPEHFRDFVSSLTLPAHAKHKLRIVYGDEIVSFSIEPYTKKEIHSLKLIYVNHNFYAHKFLDRSQLDAYKTNFEPGTEVLFCINGELCETSFSSIILEAQGQFFVPKSYLLTSTTRERLIFEGKVSEERLMTSDLHRFDHIHLVNAFNNIGELRLPIKAIEL